MGSEPSSVIYSQTKEYKKLKVMLTNVLNKMKLIGWYNKPTSLQFQSILNTENFDALKHYESTEADRRTWLHVHLIWNDIKGLNSVIF